MRMLTSIDGVHNLFFICCRDNRVNDLGARRKRLFTEDFVGRQYKFRSSFILSVVFLL